MACVKQRGRPNDLVRGVVAWGLNRRLRSPAECESPAKIGLDRCLARVDESYDKVVADE
jgi:hypothetical protein